MKGILERIAKSLESIDKEFKASRVDREQFKQQLSQMEQMIADIADDPFGLSKQREPLSKKGNG